MIGGYQHGLGITAGQAVQVGSSIGTPVVTAVAAPSVATAIGVSTAVAVPVIGAAIAGVTILITELIANSGCGITCVETSQWADQAAQLLDQNIHAYFSNSTRTVSMQQQALANFDAIWAKLVSMCSDPQTGNAGKRCISDRQAGACTWKQTASKVPSWGTPAIGECWNWFNGYRDPIASDANVVADSLGEGVTSSITSMFGGSGLLYVGVFALALGLYAMSGSD